MASLMNHLSSQYSNSRTAYFSEYLFVRVAKKGFTSYLWSKDDSLRAAG